MEPCTFRIEGMNCGHCLNQVTRVLSRLEGVHVQRVTIGEAVLGYDPDHITPQRIVQAIKDVGYDAQLSGRTA